MDHALWKQLQREMARRVWAMDAADMMIPYADGLRSADRAAERSDAARQAADQMANQVQEWRSLEHRMGQALIALEAMGFVQNESPFNAGMRLSAREDGTVLDSENPPEAAP